MTREQQTRARPVNVNGVTFACWRTGIMKHEWRSIDGRIRITGDAFFYCTVDNKPVRSNKEKWKRFRTRVNAMRVGVMLSKKVAE